MTTEAEVREIASAAGAMLDGLNCYDTFRALLSLISCNLCGPARDDEQLEIMLAQATEALREQVHSDWQKVKAMKAAGTDAPIYSRSMN